MQKSCTGAALPNKVPDHRYNAELMKDVGPVLISPHKNVFLQNDTIDTCLPEDLDDDSLIPLSPSLTDEEYLFTLTDSDLFDSCYLWDDT